MDKPTLIMMSKAPVPGRVKTRLAHDTSDEIAAEVQRAFIRDITARFGVMPCRTVVACAPDGEQSAFQSLVESGWELWEQGGGALGDRLRRAAERVFREKTGPVVFIGSDSPTLPTWLVERAFESLSSSEVVVGPAFDGGYYLIGVRSGEAPIYSEIPWGTQRVFSTTVRRLEETSTTYRILPFWYDIDDLQSLRRMHLHLACDGPYGPIEAPRTAALLRKLDLF